MQAFYFYRHYAADPYFNMAFDEAMLDYVLRHPDVILIRLYTWTPGTITIGRNQDLKRALDISRLGSTPLIRRVTGGRAVYHDPSELTYAVAVNPEGAGLEAWNGSISDVYLYLAQVLRKYLEALGRQSRVVRSSSEPVHSPSVSRRQPCFASAARYELMAAGGKVIASAQRRIGRALLQHGSIKLEGVASHAALDVKTVVEHELQPLGKREFDKNAELFMRTWQSALGGPPGRVSPALESSNSFERRLEKMRTDPLGCRNTFEQTGESKSL
jgi:lipoate-protein ligase A